MILVAETDHMAWPRAQIGCFIQAKWGEHSKILGLLTLSMLIVGSSAFATHVNRKATGHIPWLDLPEWQELTLLTLSTGDTEEHFLWDGIGSGELVFIDNSSFMNFIEVKFHRLFWDPWTCIPYRPDIDFLSKWYLASNIHWALYTVYKLIDRSSHLWHYSYL